MKRQFTLWSSIISFSFLIFACSDSGDPVSPGPTGPEITVGDITVAEGDVAMFVISLTQAADSAVTFSYQTSNGSAAAGTDYTAVPATAGSIPQGNTTLIVNVATTNNAIADGTRTFNLVVSNVVGATLSDNTGVASITDDEVLPVSYAGEVQPILSSRCAIPGCHGAGVSSGGLTMGSGASWNIVRNASGDNGSIISAGDASSSNLYLKTTSSPPFLGRMPVGGQLTIAEQNLIRDWINEGALDN